MHLKKYIAGERGRASALAQAIGVSPSYLSQMASGTAAISPIKSVEIESVTNGVVSRKDLHPDDWKKIWPELATQPDPKEIDKNEAKRNGGMRLPMHMERVK